jgi:hypothetical protein
MEHNQKSQAAQVQIPAQQSSMEPNTNSPRSEKTKYILFGLLLLLFLIVIGGGVYYLRVENNQSTRQNIVQRPRQTIILTPTPSVLPSYPNIDSLPPYTVAPGSWKTFQNANLSIEFPSNWYVNNYVNTVNNNIVEINDYKGLITGYFSDKHMRIQIGYYQTKMPANICNDMNLVPNSTKNITVNNYAGVRCSWEGVDGGSDHVYLADPNGNGYTKLEYIAATDSGELIFNKIISTFKFIN